MADVLAEVEFVLDGDYVCIDERFDEDADVRDRLVSVEMSLFLFHKFSDSRWGMVGVSCRTLVLSMCVGLSHVLKLVRASPRNSEYYTHGWDRFDGEARYFTDVAALAAFVPEAPLLELAAGELASLRRL